MLKTTRLMIVCLLLSVIGGAAVARAQQAPQPPQPPVYTVCTLLVGSAPAPAAAGMEGARTIMTALAGTKWSSQELEQNAENLAELQEKLKSAFRLDQIDVVSSYGDWMSSGRQMVLEGGGLKLVVTAGNAKDYVSSEVTVHAGDRTEYSTKQTKANATGYQVSLTQGGKPLLTKSWSIAPGMRSVLARQAEAGGPLYFVVLAVPQPGFPMRTTFGWELEDSQSARVTGFQVAQARGAAGGSGSGIGSGVGIGTAQEIQIHAPKKLSGAQPALSPEARAAGLKGPVILAGTIAADGTVQNIKVLKSVEGLDEIAIAAFKTWRYEPPATDRDGKPVPIVITVVFPFQDEPQEDR